MTLKDLGPCMLYLYIFIVAECNTILSAYNVSYEAREATSGF